MITQLLATLAQNWRPFMDPIERFHTAWLWLLPLMALGVAFSWKALRLPDMDRLLPEALKLATTIVLAMVAAGAGLWILTELVK